jgi:hypothetical protein
MILIMMQGGEPSIRWEDIFLKVENVFRQTIDVRKDPLPDGWTRLCLLLLKAFLRFNI